MPALGALSPFECWTRLAAEYTALLAFCDDGDVHVMPINLGIQDQQVWFRTAEGTKLRAARDGARMAVSVQHHMDLDHGGWSVTVRGPATVEAEGPPVRGAPPVRPWVLDAREGQWVRVAVDTITGRELRLGVHTRAD